MNASERLKIIYLYTARYKLFFGGLSPTRREIANALKMSSTSMINYYLEILHEMDLIRFGNGTRNIIMVGEKYIPPDMKIEELEKKISERKTRKKKKKVT